MDLSNLAPDLGKLLGLSPSTVVLLLFILVKAANVGARIIPNDATGWQGALRKLCAIVGVYVSSRVSPGVTINDVVASAAATSPITEKVSASTGVPVEEIKESAPLAKNPPSGPASVHGDI